MRHGCCCTAIILKSRASVALLFPICYHLIHRWTEVWKIHGLVGPRRAVRKQERYVRQGVRQNQLTCAFGVGAKENSSDTINTILQRSGALWVRVKNCSSDARTTYCERNRRQSTIAELRDSVFDSRIPLILKYRVQEYVKVLKRQSPRESQGYEGLK